MTQPHISSGVCIKPTPSVEKYLAKLDEPRIFFAQWKIAANGSKRTPGESFDVDVMLSKDKHVIFTCVVIQDSAIEIIVLSFEEISFQRAKGYKKLITTIATVTLIAMELIYYGGHNISTVTKLVQSMLSP